MGGVGIAVGGGERVHDPGEAAVVADHDVGVLVEGEEGRERGDAVAHVAAHQQAAVGVDVVAEGQLAEVVAVEREADAAQEAAERDAAGALVGGEAVGLALRVVELLLPRLDVDVGVGQLAEVDLRAA